MAFSDAFDMAQYCFGSLRTVLEAVFDLREGPGIIRGKILDVKMVVIASILLTANIGITTPMTAVGRDIIEQLGLPTAQALQALGYGTAYGAIFLMFLLILALLALTQICDAPPGYWALWCFVLLVLLLIAYQTMLAYQRRIDGPLP